jgi:hypothetical protein
MKINDQIIPVDVLEQVQTKISEAQKLLAPYILVLSPEERHEIPKMGEKTVSFVEKAHDLAKQNPDLTPRHFNMDAFSVDYDKARELRVLSTSIRQLETNINDTEMAAGSEAYQTALSFYRAVKAATSDDVAGAKAVYEELRIRFPGGRRRSTNT